ncbi:aldose 1-epimerase [Paenibacillus agricola]|uniref:Aldose 1-epimerase n=1 Tax=Paenibacillus agricola TaxID=2716264 RepID=A0ABX0J3G5_9BACL|nr:aldose 1-epimerase [Paenibacillus agricola]NHN29368.1 aldose 1-epimerase [Paenibacillus agricola]
MNETSVQAIQFFDEPAIQLNAGGYQAVIVPGLGANMVELSRPNDHLSFLRTPDTIEKLRQSGQRYGIPPLFPPNRIVGGIISTPYRDYVLTPNTPDGQNYMHGILHKRPWEVKFSGVREDGAAEVTLLMNMDQSGDMFAYFPHEFTYEITYTLSEQGLHQQVLITNLSNEPMPLGVGFHTAFKVPFHADGSEQDYLLQVSAKEKWELTSMFVPTGNIVPLDEKDKALPLAGVRPTGEAYATHVTSEAMERKGASFHGAVLVDTKRDISFVYEVDPAFGHWTIWNDDGQSGFICPEPQTWAINAPNLALPDDITGFQLLAPGAGWSASCKLYVEQ